MLEKKERVCVWVFAYVCMQLDFPRTPPPIANRVPASARRQPPPVQSREKRATAAVEERENWGQFHGQSRGEEPKQEVKKDVFSTEVLCSAPKILALSRSS